MGARRRFLHKASLFLLIAGLLAGMMIPAQAASAADFSDVSTSSWYYDAVDYVTSEGLFQGTSSTTFSPKDYMTRGMFITVLGRFAGVDPAPWRDGSSYHRFSDVSSSAYYAGYAVWGYEKGIVNGQGSSDIFAPNEYITRQQVCALLNRYAKVMGLSLSKNGTTKTFTDDSKISSWAKEDVYAMASYGVVNGTTDGSFDPNSYATRAETAAMFQRFDAAAGGSAAPSPTATPEPTKEPDPGDTPATKVSGTVSIKSNIIRVGILLSTKSYHTCTTSVTLENTNGSGFEYGVMNGRSFSGQGSVASTTVKITTDGSSLTLSDSSGNAVYSTSGYLAIHPTGNSKTVTCVNGEYRYYGDFELRQAANDSGKIAVTNYVDVEDYVKGVLPYEFSNGWPAEALKAAAVAVRSFVMSYDWSIYSSYGMDIVNNSSAQLYRGRAITYSESYFNATDAAVEATRGEYLTYNGQICVTSYSSCDGGTTKSGDKPYLQGKTDPYEQKAAGEISDYASAVANSHRIGMSAWGAYAMAKYYDKDYQTILGFYYTGTNLQNGA